MNRHYTLFIIVVLSILPILASTQTRAELERRRTQTMEQIRYTNQLLSKTKESQRESYNNLLLLNNQINSRKELIKHIKEEISLVEYRIRETEGIVESLEEDLEKLKDEYAKMLRVAWKNHNTFNNIMFIFSSESFNQTFLRLRHMQQLARHRKIQFKAIDYVQHVLRVNVERLAETKMVKEGLLKEEEEATRTLNREQRNQQQVISKLQGQEEELKRKLQEHQQQAQRLQQEIQRLIAEEAKRTSGSATGTYALTPAEQIISTNFGNNRGKLPWPVERGVVVSHFGKQRHPVLRNIEIDNRGIDIATTQGAMARAIFDGEVRQVISLPGAHNAVIIRHGAYLSVYTNLQDVLVKVGDQVSTNQHIGTIYTDPSENRTVIHLEIWEGNTTLNPALWLSK